MVKKLKLRAVPNPSALRRKAQSLAMRDVSMTPDCQYRYYSFNSKWGDDEIVTWMTDGCGNNFFILFNQHGSIPKGFDHESFMRHWARDDNSLWPGIFNSVPPEFAQFLKEPAFDIPNTTFCMGRLNTDRAWQTDLIIFPDNQDGADGSEEMLSFSSAPPNPTKNLLEPITGKSCHTSALKESTDMNS